MDGSGIEKALERLRGRVSEVEECVGGLNEKLSCIQRPLEPIPDTTDSEKLESTCELAGAILAECGRLNDVIEKISNLRSRIDL